MTRTRWIYLTLALLLVANVAWHLYSRWGLITVQVDNRPLAQVLRSIEKQGGVTIRTDIPGDTPVTMHVHLVNLHEALETLSAVTECRWRLAYVFGPDKGAIATLLGTVAAGQRPDGWKTASYPLPPVGDIEANLPPDPRADRWTVKDVPTKTAQDYLEQGARSVSAAFVFPETWNPAIASAPSSGKVSSVASKLAARAGGAEQEVILLLRGPQSPDVAETDDESPRFNRGPRNWLSNKPGAGGSALAGLAAFAGMEERVRAEIDKLPPVPRTAALAELEERKAFMLSLQGLTPEQRRAKFEDLMNQPGMQERMDQQRLDREARQTPAQRQARAQKYQDRRAQYLTAGPAK